MAQGIRTIYRFSVNSLPQDAFEVVQFTGEEAISQPFRFDFVLAATDPNYDVVSLAGEAAEFTISKDDFSRTICGIVSDFYQMEETTPGIYLYRAVLVPRLDRLKLSRQNQIYGTIEPVDVITIVTHELGESVGQAGPQRRGNLSLSSTDYDVRITGSYPTRDYVVQYNESDFDFISRQLEHWGIFYFFDHSTGVDRIVLGDNNVNFGQIAGPTTVTYAPPSIKTSVGTASVSSLVCRARQIPTEVTLRDYNYRTPKVDLLVQTQVDPAGFGWVNEYDDHFRTPSEGTMLAKIRAEEFCCRKVTYVGNSDCNRFEAGHCFTLDNHFRSSFDQEYLLVSVQHRGAQPVFGVATLGGEMAPSAIGYENTFIAIPAGTPFRPERVTRLPKIAGVMTGRIDGAGDGNRAEIDELGRYKVTVQFDLGGYPAGQASQYIRLAQPYAGANSGMHFPLLKGTEVLLSHIDGDPDRPIIIGSVPDAASLIVSNQGSNDRNRIVTPSGSFFEMCDGQGSSGGNGSSGSTSDGSDGGFNGASANAWQPPSGGLFNGGGGSGGGGGGGTWIRMGEPTQNGYFRIGCFDATTESGLLPRMQCQNYPGASASASSGGSTGSNALGGSPSSSNPFQQSHPTTPNQSSTTSSGSTNTSSGVYTASFTSQNIPTSGTASFTSQTIPFSGGASSSNISNGSSTVIYTGPISSTVLQPSSNLFATSTTPISINFGSSTVANGGSTGPNNFVANNATSSGKTSSETTTVDTGGALSYANGYGYEKYTGDNISDVGGDKITQVDGNQYTQVNVNDWKYVGGTETQTYVGAVANDYKNTVSNTYEGDYTGGYDGTTDNTYEGTVTATYHSNYQSTYYANYEAYIFGNQLKTMIGFTEDISLGMKNTVVALSENKLNILEYGQVNLAAMMKFTLGTDMSMLVGPKMECIIGASTKTLVGAQNTNLEGVIISNQEGDKNDLRVGVVTTITEGVKCDSQTIKMDFTQAASCAVKGTEFTVEQVRMNQNNAEAKMGEMYNICKLLTILA